MAADAQLRLPAPLAYAHIATAANWRQTGGMKHDLSAELRQNRRAVRKLYSSSLMPNAKWRSVIIALDDDNLGLRQAVVKFTEVEGAKTISLPFLNLWLDSPYAAVDCFEFGPFPVIEIEWIEIPVVAIFPRFNNLPALRYAQDIAAVRSALLGLGKKLPLEDTSTGLRIIGHVR